MPDSHLAGSSIRIGLSERGTPPPSQENISLVWKRIPQNAALIVNLTPSIVLLEQFTQKETLL